MVYGESIKPEETKELIMQYCSAIDNRLVGLLALVSVMWLIEPLVKKILAKHVESGQLTEEISKTLIIMYKWIGIGILFMVGYALVITN